MKHISRYLDWYIHVGDLAYDLRSSGIQGFRYDLNLSNLDLGANYAYGNPETARILAQRYNVKPENIFISGEGATGQNTRIFRIIAEKYPRKNEAIVEYPTYEPVLRQVQEFYPVVKRLDRKEKDMYHLDVSALRDIISERTGLLVITNPHAPSGTILLKDELKATMEIAHENEVFVDCDEIYAEFNRGAVPTVFSVDSDFGIVTTSFTKAYGLGGLKLGIALGSEMLVKEVYQDVLNTIGNSPNLVQTATIQLLTTHKQQLEEHKQKWLELKRIIEDWFVDNQLDYWPNNMSITYWLKLPVKDSYEWINRQAIEKYRLGLVPGAFFMFEDDYRLIKTSMTRLGFGAIKPESETLERSLDVLSNALSNH